MNESSENAGLDYSLGRANVDKSNGIHFGVISQNEILQSWADSSKPIYPEPETCETCNGTGLQLDENGTEMDEPCVDCMGNGTVDNDVAEAIGFNYTEDGYEASCGEDGDIFITKSPYFTLCTFCSPCAPGAGDIMSPTPKGIKAYCFGHDWFESGKAPYPVYRVSAKATKKTKSFLIVARKGQEPFTVPMAKSFEYRGESWIVIRPVSYHDRVFRPKGWTVFHASSFAMGDWSEPTIAKAIAKLKELANLIPDEKWFPTIARQLNDFVHENGFYAQEKE